MSGSTGRWPQGLGLRDWLALVFIGPLLGWLLMVGWVGLSDRGKLDRDAIRAALMHGWWHSWVGLLGGLAVIGIVLGVLSPTLRGFAAVSVMIPIILFVIDDYWEYGKGRIIGAVVVLYLLLTWVPVFIGWAFTDVLRFARERRRVRTP